MRSAFAWSLVAAAAALPAPQVSEIREATTCPDLDGAQVVSSNNVPYKLECKKWVYNLDDIKIVDTEVGVQGCLTACDNTVDCAFAQYVATDWEQTKGSCTLYQKDVEIRNGTSDSWTLATLIEDTPAPQPLKFGGLSLRSASAVHFLSLNANGQNFWLGRNTSVYCPDIEGTPCPADTPLTVFSQAPNTTTLALNTVVPGGQQIYVTEGTDAQSAGQLKYTQAHSAMTVGTPVFEGFNVTQNGTLTFEGDDWLACPVYDLETPAWTIFSAARAEEDIDEACLSISILATESGNYTAWQYS